MSRLCAGNDLNKSRGIMRLRGLLLRFLGVFLLFQCAAYAADEPDTRLLRQPAVSKDHLAFVWAGDIWVSDRDGGRQ
jgi:hypothetical protein